MKEKDKDKATSSGVEKVEKISDKKKDTTKKQANDKVSVASMLQEKQAKEEALAKRRVLLAEAKQKAQEASNIKTDELDKRISQYEKEREKRLEKMRAERDKKEHKAAREARRENERKSDKRNKGNGGWIASVVSLSVAVLALGTIVTVGYFDLNNAQNTVMDNYQSAVYEFSEHVENLDNSLSKARVATGSYEQQKLLTNIILSTELASQSLAKFPADFAAAQQLAAQLNDMNKKAWTLLYKQLNGKTFIAEDEKTVEELYNQVERMRSGMPALMDQTKTLKLDEMLKEDGKFAKGLLGLTEAEAVDGGAVGMLDYSNSFVSKMAKISEEEATQKAMQYFSDYNIDSMHMTGKTEEGAPSYTFEMKDKDGRAYYCAITEQGGLLSMFSSYDAVTPKQYSQEECIAIAKKFLEKCGYNNMEAIWTSEYGNEMNVRFAYMQNNVAIYADTIDVKVCNNRGLATGLIAKTFIKNHRDRSIGKATLSQKTVETNASKKLKLHGTRLALLPQEGGEVLTYEIRGDYGDRSYVVFVDANAGKMVEIYNVSTTDRGRVLI